MPETTALRHRRCMSSTFRIYSGAMPPLFTMVILEKATKSRFLNQSPKNPGSFCVGEQEGEQSFLSLVVRLDRTQRETRTPGPRQRACLIRRMA